MIPYVNTICFAQIKNRLEAGKYWGLQSPITPFQVDGCLDLISDSITGITDKEQLVNALRSICWQIVIGKRNGTNDRESGGHVLSKQTVEKLFDAMNTAIKSSGVSVKPREISIMTIIEPSNLCSMTCRVFTTVPARKNLSSTALRKCIPIGPIVGKKTFLTAS